MNAHANQVKKIMRTLIFLRVVFMLIFTLIIYKTHTNVILTNLDYKNKEKMEINQKLGSQI